MKNARRSLVASATIGLVILIAGCGASTGTTHTSYDCLNVGSSASKTTFSTHSASLAKTDSIDLVGIMADVDVKVSNSTTAKYTFEAPKELQSALTTTADERESKLTIGFSCSANIPTIDRLPKLTVTVGGGVALSINDPAGKVTVGDINGPLSISMDHTDDAAVGRVTSLNATVSGTGDVNVSHVAGDHTELHSSGTGDITIKSGDTPRLFIDASGTGNTTFKGHADNATLSNFGTGDVSVGSVGKVDEHNTGTGDITIG